MTQADRQIDEYLDGVMADWPPPTPEKVQEIAEILHGPTENAGDPREHAVVYYAAWNGLIKIGTSCEVGRRIRELKTNLLATEPGSYELEHKRHCQFAESRITGEWFRPTPELMQHISLLP